MRPEEQFLYKYDALKEMEDAYFKVKDIVNKYTNNIRIGEKDIFISIDDWEELNKLIDELRAINMNMKKRYIFENEEGQMTLTFRDDGYPLVIWFDFDIKDPPKEILNICEVKTIREEKITHELVCKL